MRADECEKGTITLVAARVRDGEKESERDGEDEGKEEQSEKREGEREAEGESNVSECTAMERL